jgi:hypothetical protein
LTNSSNGCRVNIEALEGKGIIELSFGVIWINDGGEVTEYSRRSDSRVSFAARQARKLQVCGHFSLF